MSVHPDYFGQGVARRLLSFICDVADQQRKPVRLVSSAMNVDSFSLYNRAGFVPRDLFQVMTIPVPPAGLPRSSIDTSRVRPARVADIPRMVELESIVSGIERAKDYLHFIGNREGIWQTLLIEDAAGDLEGFLVSVRHPGSMMIGPGTMRTDDAAASLILAQLDHFRGASPACLVPAGRPGLVQQLYSVGFKNSELSLFQSRGEAQPFRGIVIPTFMPETG